MSDYTPAKICSICENPTSLCQCPEINQCDGCRRGLPMRYSRVVPESRTLLHFDPDAGYVVMACTADRYQSSHAARDEPTKEA